MWEAVITEIDLVGGKSVVKRKVAYECLETLLYDLSGDSALDEDLVLEIHISKGGV